MGRGKKKKGKNKRKDKEKAKEAEQQAREKHAKDGLSCLAIIVLVICLGVWKGCKHSDRTNRSLVPPERTTGGIFSRPRHDRACAWSADHGN